MTRETKHKVISNFDNFNFKNHLSPSLQWRWMFKPFKVVRVETKTSNSVRVVFKTGYWLAYRILDFFYKGGVPISGYVCSRLAFSAAIIAVGHTLKKEKKDGEVIVRNLNINYDAPVMYSSNTEIVVDIEIDILKETDKYHLFTSKFTVGRNQGHVGTSTLFYCKPNLKNFAYLS